ncbi:MFS transporter [Arthrobacter sp. JZ12]|uniref:MFS transporter n=1 Tax=Arthrobacter sp. JZ12 TaxID=2654190 RepID=UPI002B4918A1|nr:MFS transporter [Arthrobacter sp. JZ12]
MTNTAHHEGTRVPLTITRAIATFGISVVGFMTANLIPVMILALADLGYSATGAGTLMTACLLLSALSCLATSRWTARNGRYLVARVGLALAALGFGAAAIVPDPLVAGIGIVLAGIGSGGAVAAGGAALAALRNPDRASGISGFTNRGIVAIVLFIIPAVGIAMGSAFGILAGLALVALAVVHWLPASPAQPVPSTVQASPASGRPSRLEMIAGFGLLACFAVWALGEDSLWAVAAVMGEQQAGLDETGMGLVLSLSTLGGLLASAIISLWGPKIGRTAPLVVALLAGAALKIASGFITDPQTYLVVIIAWNTIYIVAFLYVIAISAALDPTGRWSGPILGVYLVGSSFSPLFGTAVSSALGFQALGVILGGITLLVLVPLTLISRLSRRVERAGYASPAPENDFPKAAIA